MIRPILAETKRYGDYSLGGESVYDHPFQWGSRRIGPDLAREGGKQSPDWHIRHFRNPRETSQDKSIMPNYAWLLESKAELDAIPQRMRGMRMLGVPYTDEQIEKSVQNAEKQADEIVAKIKEYEPPKDFREKKVIALIAYLDKLGRDISQPPPAAAPTPASAPIPTTVPTPATAPAPATKPAPAVSTQAKAP
jgi:cytochrome c oxidase cbb3-type subunit I/II